MFRYLADYKSAEGSKKISGYNPADLLFCKQLRGEEHMEGQVGRLYEVKLQSGGSVRQDNSDDIRSTLV